MANSATTAISPGESVSYGRRLLAQAPRLTAIFLVLLLILPTGLIAIGEGAALLPLPYNLFLVDERLPGIFKLHMLASGAALVLIPLVFSLRRHRAWHRPLGRLTALLVLFGALTSLPVALASHSVAVARAGFLAQGLAWLALIALGALAARRRQFDRHAQLMVAMAAVASGALWVRLATTVATTCDLPFDAIYGAAAWLGWLMPLAVVTLWPPPLVPARR